VAISGTSVEKIPDERAATVMRRETEDIRLLAAGAECQQDSLRRERPNRDAPRL